MKYSKVVYVTLQDTGGNRNRGDDVYAARDDDFVEKYEIYKDFSCQYDSKRDNVKCTCKRPKREEAGYFCTSRQVYRSLRYKSSRGFTDVGVGSVKTVPRKRVRRIYLPHTEDRGVGSSDLSSFLRRTRNGESYYDQKKTSSKCVGGAMECNDTSVLSEKLSPICQTKSRSTSPNRASFEASKNSDNHSILSDTIVGMKQVSGAKTDNKGQGKIMQETFVLNTHADKNNEVPLPNTSNIKSAVVDNDVKDFSSDSLVQRVHNLEYPSSYKQSEIMLDLKENKLEGEYIKMFETNSKHSPKPIAEVKPIQDSKSTTMRKRFEALRRGLSKKEVSNENCVAINSSSHISAPSRKDVSITSDPPSLEARSFTNTKIQFPIKPPLHINEDLTQILHRKPVNGEKETSHWSTDVVDGDSQNVKGMFKLWGKKFKLDDDDLNKTPSHTMEVTKKQKKKVELILPKEDVIDKEKKEGNRFSFFKRKSKDKSKQPYKSKNGVTAGRCEVGDGLTIKIGAANESPEAPPRKKSKQTLDGYDDFLRKAWLKRCLDKHDDSRNSVKIRWNNDMYTTSSSTVFELLECIYKNTGIIFRSESEVTFSTAPSTTSGERSYYRSYKNPHVNFMQQTIQAWMIPRLIPDNDTEKSIKTQNSKKENRQRDIEVTFSNQKWFIEKSKAFSQNIELVLNSKIFVKDQESNSSKYIVIDIPKGYFSETSSEYEDQTQTSDEQVYNIVEYETVKSSSYLKNKRNDRKMDIGDHESNDIRVTINVKDMDVEDSRVVENAITTPPQHRDVVIQGSHVYVPKRCDVIGVGIITQHTHNRDIKKPKLNMQDEITDDESTHAIAPQKKCELAEDYLQDYYRHWTPLGMDIYSWCISESHLRDSSDNNSLNSLNQQGDGSKSCPNICDDFQTSAIISSCETSSCSHFTVQEETTTYYNKLQMKDPQKADKRVFPKDSVEVFKRRKIYAASKLGYWCTSDEISPTPSGERLCPQKSSECCIIPETNVTKHVSLKDLEEPKISEGILSFKGSSCNIGNKKTRINPKSVEITVPPCLESCTQLEKPPCLKTSANRLTSRTAKNLPPLKKPPLVPSISYCPRRVKSVTGCQERKEKLPTPPQECSPKASNHQCECTFNSSKPPTRRKQKTHNIPTPPRECSPLESNHQCGGCAYNSPKQKSSSPRCCSIKTPPCLSQVLTKQSSPASSKLTTAFKRLTKKCKSNTWTKKEKLDTDLMKKCTERKNEIASCPSSTCCLTSKTGSQPKSGLYLTKKPMPSNSAKNENIIKLNSKENIFIKIKQMTPSTDEIRDNRNIRVEDEDGQTLYERHEYKTNACDSSRNHLVKGLYRESRIHRVSTSNTEKVLDEKNVESCVSNISLSNVVEISFNLKFKQPDKTTKGILKKDKQRKAVKKEKGKSQTNVKDVFLVQDKTKQSVDLTEDLEKRDVNIKIVINSYQQNPNKSKRKLQTLSLYSKDDEFTKKISEKFQTVSTGYSGVLDLQSYSMHKSTVNFSDSTDTSKHLIRPSEELRNEELSQKSPINSTDIESVTKLSTFEHSDSLVTANNTVKEQNQELPIPNDISQNIDISATDKEKASPSFVQHSDVKIPKIRNKEEKKKILKQIFESSNDTGKTANRSIMGSIRKMLHSVLTSDSSEADDVSVNNDLAKEITYQSLKPNFFKDSESLTNCCRLGSSTSEYNRPSKNVIDEILLPTGQNNSSDTVESNGNQDSRCPCKQMGTKLNIFEGPNLKPCCCRGFDKKDKEVDCNLAQDTLTYKKADYVDVETQDSYLLCKYKKKGIQPQRFKDTNKKPKKVLSGNVKGCAMKKMNRKTLLGLSDDDKVIILNSESQVSRSQGKTGYRKGNRMKPIDILQLHETKKAVLEIFAEKTVIDHEEGLVAKLPKFVYNRENEICNYYQETVRDFQQFSERNIVMMSFTR